MTRFHRISEVQKTDETLNRSLHGASGLNDTNGVNNGAEKGNSLRFVVLRQLVPGNTHSRQREGEAEGVVSTAQLRLAHNTHSHLKYNLKKNGILINCD